MKYAFPSKEGQFEEGMTLLDYFAGQVLASGKFPFNYEASVDDLAEYQESVADFCYQSALSMMYARECIISQINSGIIDECGVIL